jgi:hypothetical protein
MPVVTSGDVNVMAASHFSKVHVKGNFAFFRRNRKKQEAALDLVTGAQPKLRGTLQRIACS